MTVEEKLIAVAEKLLENTKSGKRIWEETADEDKFILSTKTYSVTIERISSTSPDSYRLGLLNEQGKELEALFGTYRDIYRETLQELFDVARRTALGVDHALDEVLSQLDEPLSQLE